jgi:inner membrane protein
VTGRTHDLAAITALGAVVLAQPAHDITLATAFIAVFANLIGGITPDVDQPTAPFWRNLPIGGVFGRIVDRLLGGHRFITHSLLGAAAIAYLAHLLLVFLRPIMNGVDANLVWWAFVIGLASHLVMDSFTKEGVPWLLPVPIKFGLPPLKAFRITTGRAVEMFIVFPGLIALNLWLYYSHYHQVLDLLHNHIRR